MEYKRNKKNNLKINKKGLFDLGQAPAIITLVLVIGIMLVIGLRIEGDLQTGFTDNSTEDNATDNIMDGLGNISENQGLLGTIIIFSIIISTVIISFALQ